MIEDLIQNEVDRIFPSAVLYDRILQTFWFGHDAVGKQIIDGYYLTNWKLLLGNTKEQIKTEAIINNDFRIFESLSIDEITQRFLEHVLQVCENRLKNLYPELPNIQEIPCVFGIPTIDDQKWLSRYRDTLRSTLKNLGFKNPIFYPEAFAIYQFHLSNGNIPDLEREQNVLLIDMGGGTTNSCVIITKKHGGLSRGGANSVPIGVKTVRVGGSTLDRLLLEHIETNIGKSPTYLEGQKLLLFVKALKEKLCNRIKNWTLNASSEIDISASEDFNGRAIAINNKVLLTIFRDKVWPIISAMIDGTIAEAEQTKETNQINFDALIIAGGGSKNQYLKELILDQYSDRLSNAKIVQSKNHDTAVSMGLIYEIRENKKLYDDRIKSASHRITPYLIDDIFLLVSHNNKHVSTKIHADDKTKQLVRSARTLIIQAPQLLMPLYASELSWDIMFKQKPRNIFYDVIRKYGITSERLNYSSRVIRLNFRDVLRVDKKLKFKIAFDEEGIGKCAFIIDKVMADSTTRTFKHNVGNIDLHALSHIDNDSNLFIGIDFGTSKTSISLCSIALDESPAIIPIERYYINEEANKRAQEIDAKCKKLKFGINAVRDYCLRKDIIIDYIYESNRIEGSQLNRGETEYVISETESTTQNRAQRSQAAIDRDGNIIKDIRLVKDYQSAVNLKEAYDMLLGCINEMKGTISEAFIRSLHGLLKKEMPQDMPGQYRNREVTISGASYQPPKHIDVPILMKNLVDYINDPTGDNNGITTSVKLHTHFVAIHPFLDGNGRIARLLVNYILMSSGMPMLLLEAQDRDRYYDALENANDRDLSDLTILFCDCIENSIKAIEHEEDSKKRESRKEENMKIEAQIEEITKVESEKAIDVESPIGALLKKLTEGDKIFVSEEERYRSWAKYFETLKQEFNMYTETIGKKLRATTLCDFVIRGFPVLDYDKYLTILKRQSFTKSWYLRLYININNIVDSTIFYFKYLESGRIEKAANGKLYPSCVSLGISQYSGGNYIRHDKIEGMRIKEIFYYDENAKIITSNKNGNYKIVTMSNDELIATVYEDLFRVVYKYI